MKIDTIVENNLSDDESHFYLSGALAGLTGQLRGHVASMKDDSLDSLDKKYFADKIEEISNDLKEITQWLYNNNHSSLDVKS